MGIGILPTDCFDMARIEALSFELEAASSERRFVYVALGIRVTRQPRLDQAVEIS
jgi:hypothetical protein